MNLTNEQIEKKNNFAHKLRGRIGVIFNPYFTKFTEGTKIYIMNYIPEEGVFKVTNTENDKVDFCFRDEFNLIDKEFSDYKIIKKGVRVERKDKYDNSFIIELLPNQRDIYLSTALSSLLNLNNKDKSYVGFASDPDTKSVYIFETDENTGYEFNKSNNRITSKADWRELNTMFEDCLAFKVVPQPIIDNQNNPGCVFYTLFPDYYLSDNLHIKPKKEVIKQGKSQVHKVGNNETINFYKNTAEVYDPVIYSGKTWRSLKEIEENKGF